MKKEYEVLSLGQKSIYDLKYKFNKSINEDLYLDQPENKSLYLIVWKNYFIIFSYEFKRFLW